jgi:hypothetical protein
LAGLALCFGVVIEELVLYFISSLSRDFGDGSQSRLSLPLNRDGPELLNWLCGFLLNVPGHAVKFFAPLHLRIAILRPFDRRLIVFASRVPFAVKNFSSHLRKFGDICGEKNQLPFCALCASLRLRISLSPICG